ncbi:hypothetical protein [Candidatus Williamhamiltonella defendens]|uniref:hypothetical protein n=1 Tax=Candidatus Williamhamiltonella defendens TaxID=138072 RepID=UPI001C9D8C60|nr:hypothetical protein [Candidatus Hamiltonella defensa]
MHNLFNTPSNKNINPAIQRFPNKKSIPIGICQKIEEGFFGIKPPIAGKDLDVNPFQ